MAKLVTKKENQFIGHMLKVFRESNYLTQTDVAEVLNLSQPMIAYVEKGASSIDPSHLMVLADKYKLNPCWVLGFSKEMYLSKYEGYTIKDKVPKKPSPFVNG